VNSIESVQFVLSHYPSDCRLGKIQPLGSAGGFSGAEFWKVLSIRGPLCVRRWPKEHPTQSRINFIHRLLRHVVQKGFTLVPAPIPLDSDSCQTHLKFAGHFWELTPWMPGDADYQQSPSNEKLQAAMRALAGFHQAASDCISVSPELGVPRTVQDRIEQVNTWIQSDLARLECHTGQPNNTKIQGLPQWKKLIINHAKQHLNEVRMALHAISDCKVPIQACIRDIWHQHILYRGDKVSGLIDFGAARPDTVAADLTRLLGSLTADNKSKWNCGLDAYGSVRPLSDREHSLIIPLDQSAVLLAGLNWLRWLYLENRSFSDETAVEERMQQIVSRLEIARTKTN
jgi:Ser/Thr protein kinase RdoA (MazF antagonist)